MAARGSIRWRLCQNKLAEDPFSGCVFVFRSRSGTAIRLLTYDGQGCWLAQKRLSKGRFVWWPEPSEPAATQWEIVEEAAEVIKPARDELLRQAAQGEVLHHDDTGMRVLRLAREAGDQRTGVFTSGIVATMQGRADRVVLHRTEARGENLAEVLNRRAAELPPLIQMSDARSRNVPKLPAGVEMLLARCLALGRRQFVEVAQKRASVG